MDRFIGGQKRGGGSAVGNLKSNMDRFIVCKIYNEIIMIIFKIQYG